MSCHVYIYEKHLILLKHGIGIELINKIPYKHVTKFIIGNIALKFLKLEIDLFKKPLHSKNIID
jgi:hypothetical protein